MLWAIPGLRVMIYNSMFFVSSIIILMWEIAFTLFYFSSNKFWINQTSLQTSVLRCDWNFTKLKHVHNIYYRHTINNISLGARKVHNGTNHNGTKFFKIGQKLTEIWPFEKELLKKLHPFFNSDLAIKLPNSFFGENLPLMEEKVYRFLQGLEKFQFV